MSYQDILLDNKGDLRIENGDFVVGDSGKQDIQSIINAFPGWWKQYPTIGVGMANYLNSVGKTQEIQRNIRLNLESDAFIVSTLVVEPTPMGEFKLNINANRV